MTYELFGAVNLFVLTINFQFLIPKSVVNLYDLSLLAGDGGDAVLVDLDAHLLAVHGDGGCSDVLGTT